MALDFLNTCPILNGEPTELLPTSMNELLQTSFFVSRSKQLALAAVYNEDPGPSPVPSVNMRGTLEALRRDTCRGRAVVLEIDSQILGYALLIPFWSNELGGNISEVA